MLKCQSLCKDFKVYKKEPGLKASLKSFFKRPYYIKEAVKNFSLSLDSHGLVGLLGPNGSGKTTLMKLFTGIIVPSGGSVTALGETPSKRKNSFKKNISLVMGQKSQLWWDIPAMDSLLLFQKYYEIEDDQFKKRVADLSEKLDTAKLLHIPVRKLSLGERMKMELMACLLHEPKIIFLDEPTIGLDIVSQKRVRRFLREYYESKKPLIILTSHYMADVEALCEKIILIIKGEKRFDGGMEAFKQNFKKGKAILFAPDRPARPAEREWAAGLACQWSADGLQLKIRAPEERLREITIEALNRLPVSDFHTEKVSIEEIMDQILSSAEPSAGAS